MKVCVVGLWHLGTVTAACLAALGHNVTGLDFDAATIAGLKAGSPPVFEPGLEDLVRTGLEAGKLSFTTDAAAASGAGVVWIAYDTPVDDEDRADVAYVTTRVARLFPHLTSGALVLISSQLPVGSTRRLERAFTASGHGASISFAYSLENLRLGKAISAFTQPERVVVGIWGEAGKARAGELLAPVTDHIEWMSVESAEMTKHALNAFLATSVAFINEIAALCEQTGADAKEVERGLKSEPRIGPKAYLSPGAAFAGGTLARDVAFLTQTGATFGMPMHLMAAVRQSNDLHKEWMQQKLVAVLGDLSGCVIALWGLTYKPGTDTLRRSSAVELCRWLVRQGANVRAHDPAVRTLPGDLAPIIDLCHSPESALVGAQALVVATEWPDYRSVPAAVLVREAAGAPVIDANRFLAATLGSDPRIRYLAVGKAGA